MAKHVTVRGAQPHTKDEEINLIDITISEYFPYSMNDSDVTELSKGFKEDAEKLFEALLSSLPGGTFCQLLVLMLQEKASQFIVSHKPTAEYRKMEAANDLLEACEQAVEQIVDLYFERADAVEALSIDVVDDDGNPTSTTDLTTVRVVTTLKAAIAKARGESEGQDG